jgi:predicted glycosyltransferase
MLPIPAGPDPVHEVRGLTDVTAVRRGERPAFILASSARFGYGHLARCLKIARVLVRRAPLTAYVVSPVPDFEPHREHPHVRRISLPPFALRSAAPPRRWPITDVVSTLPGVPTGRLRAHHGRLLAALVERLRPVGVLLDHFPFLLDEIFYREALVALRTSSPRALTCSGFRGVASFRYARRQRAHLRTLLERHVDLVLVYVDARTRGQVLRRHPFLRGPRPALRFVGYVCPPPTRARHPGRGPRILATFGSGVDAAPTIELVCEAFRILAGRRPGYALDVVTGGRFPPGLFTKLVRRETRPARVRVFRFVPSLETRMARYALVVGRGGYNTLTELYRSRTRGIVLPRVYPGNDEQRRLAVHLRARGGLDHVVEEARCGPARLARLMEETLARPPARRRPLDTGGAEQAAATIQAELRRRRLLGS